MANERRLRKELAEICRRLDELGFAPGSSGNVSGRVDSGHILITPTGSLLRDISAGDFVRVAMDGGCGKAGGRPSSELGVHLAIYRGRPEVRAVVHAHPPVSVGFAVARRDMGKPSNLEVYLTVGRPVLVPFAAPGDPRPLAKYLNEGNAFLLANHGAITLGGTPAEALHRMEALENFAQAVLTARLLGGERTFAAKDLVAIHAFMKRTGMSMPVTSRRTLRRAR